MSYQGTYSVYNVNLDNTHDKLLRSDHVGGLDTGKGTVDFWLKINKDERVKVQISKRYVNIWHHDENVIYRAVDKLKPLVINADGKICNNWTLKIMQMLGSRNISTPLTEEVKPLIETKIIEADPEEVKFHLDALEKESDPLVLENRLKQLSNLAGSQRIAHIPKVIPVCEEALNDQKYQDTKVLKELIHLYDLMLGFERRSNPQDYDIINLIQTNSLKSIIKISESVTDQEILRRIIYCLRNTDRKESVDAIFNIVERVNKVLYNNLKDAVIEVFFNLNSSLQNNQKKHITENIDKLLRSTNPKLQERGIELSNRSR